MTASPKGPWAEVIRADLMSTQDAPTNSDIPHSAVAAELALMRSYAGPSGPSLALAAITSKTSHGMSEVWVSLAESVLVQRPLPDVRPALA